MLRVACSYFLMCQCAWKTPCSHSMKKKLSVNSKHNSVWNTSIFKKVNLFLLTLNGTRLFFQKPFFRIFVQNRLMYGLGTPGQGLHFLNFLLFSWPNLTCSSRPAFSQIFHHLTLPGYPLFRCFFSKSWNMDIKRREVKLLNLLLLSWRNLTWKSRPIIPSFHHPTPLVGGQQIFKKTVFERMTYPSLNIA